MWDKLFVFLKDLVNYGMAYLLGGKITELKYKKEEIKNIKVKAKVKEKLKDKKYVKDLDNKFKRS